MATGPRDRPGRGRGPALAAVGIAAALVVYGGYGAHWTWTGINGHTATLWDWLHLLLLPLAAVLLPLWLRHRPQLAPGLRVAIAAVGLAFVAIVVAGYAVPWAWTGFTGNSLWDWLNLGALPLAVALIPVFLELRAGWTSRHAVALGSAAAVFLGLVLAGYLVRWRWTGFTGNTLWDWLHLLLLPLLVPVAIVPALRSLAAQRMASDEEPAAAATEEPPVTMGTADAQST